MKKIYILPNLFTTANMFCGFASVIASVDGNFLNAAWLLIVAMIFDLMDGRIARLTRATSQFGVEYDSLSDLISFGMAPAILSYLWALQPYQRLGWLVAFFYVACAGLRLARFNVSTAQVPKGYFQGLPSPFAAAAFSTLVIFANEVHLPIEKGPLLVGLLLFTGSLMVSTVYFPSFKEFKINRENSFGVLALGVLVLILIAAKPEYALFGIVYAYISIAFVVGCFRYITVDLPTIQQLSKNKLKATGTIK